MEYEIEVQGDRTEGKYSHYIMVHTNMEVERLYGVVPTTIESRGVQDKPSWSTHVGLLVACRVALSKHTYGPEWDCGERGEKMGGR